MIVNPLVSVLVPNYNRASYLKEALKSVKAQTLTDWECIIVDDGSTDESHIVALHFVDSDSRFKFLSNSPLKKGASAARNLGLENSKGKYIIFLDSDDLLAPHCLEQRVNVMETNKTLDFAVFPMLVFFNSPGDSSLVWNRANNEDDLVRFLRLDAVWQTTGPIWRRDVLLQIPMFDEKLSCWQDVGFHINALVEQLEYKKFYQFTPDCYYRKSAHGSISQQSLSTNTHLVSRQHLVLQLNERLSGRNKTDTSVLFLSFYFSFISSISIKRLPVGIYKAGKLYFYFITWYKPKLKKSVLILLFSFLRILRLTRYSSFSKMYHVGLLNLIPQTMIGRHSAELLCFCYYCVGSAYLL